MGLYGMCIVLWDSRNEDGVAEAQSVAARIVHSSFAYQAEGQSC